MISSSLISSKSCSIQLALEDMLICAHTALLTLSSFVGLSPLLLATTIDILCAPSRKTKNHTFPRRLVFLLCCWTSHRPMSHHSDCFCCARGAYQRRRISLRSSTRTTWVCKRVLFLEIEQRLHCTSRRMCNCNKSAHQFVVQFASRTMVRVSITTSSKHLALSWHIHK